jgi:hypothetical protein
VLRVSPEVCAFFYGPFIKHLGKKLGRGDGLLTIILDSKGVDELI